MGGRARPEVLKSPQPGTTTHNEDAHVQRARAYIDGAWTNGGRKGEDVINPATEKPLAQLPHASKAELDPR